mgnify:CR=1 FL=1
MGALLKDLGTVVTAVMGYVGDICSTIIGQPLLLMTTGFLLIGGCIGRAHYARCFMSAFLTSCFDLLFDLLPKVDNVLIVLPFFAILISVLFALTFKLIRGDYW